jgi:site-specific recombinase XerD
LERRQHRYTKSATAETDDLTVSRLERFAEGWFLSGEINQNSPATLSLRRMIIKNLLWYLRREKNEVCGVMELRAFLAYVTSGHKEPGGRWGNPKQIKPVTPRTVKDYHGHLRTFFRWIVDEGALDVSPVERIPVPIDREDDIIPFTSEQVDALLDAARKTPTPKRDEAIVLFLLDTGARASEVCNLTFADLDLTQKQAVVEGKGGKKRPIYFGKRTARALWNYLKDDKREADEAVFASSHTGEALTRNGLLLLLRRLGKAARIHTVSVNIHRFRHTFAVEFLKNGGNQMALMRLLGHTHIRMTSRYVHLAQADVQKQARQFSPADNLKKGTKR